MNDAARLADWIGRTEVVEDVITPTPFAALCATLDETPERPARGTPLPPLWHWLYFLPLHRQSQLGPDGHARRGGFLPPVERPRRMWAAGQFEFHEPLLVGDEVRRRSQIADIQEKSGRSGAMTFVKVRHDVFRGAADKPALTEFHDIVYRDAPAAGAESASAPQAPSESAWSQIIVPDDVLLFRYSALTFNGHRIHYDRRYATEIEGYPGTIVHGPLIATLVIDQVRHHMPSRAVERFEFRALHPTFDLNPFSVHGQPTGDHAVDLWARDHEGRLTMKAMATLAQTIP